MASKIAGLTIAINGETTGLDKALSGVNKKSRDLQSELREVERLLKLDPGNTELLAQKQKLLTDAVAGTKEKLETLKVAAQQAQEQLAKGEISEEQFRALEREVIKTEQALKKLEDQSKQFGSVLSQELKKAGQDMKDFGGKVTGVGKGMTKGVTAPILAIGAASQIAFNEIDNALDTIVTKTGAGAEAMEGFEASFKKVYGSLPVDAQKVGDAIGEINTQFGLTGEALEQATEQAIKFSEINGQDVSQVAIKAKGAIEAYGLAADDLGFVLDAVTKTAQNTGVSTDKLFDSMTRGAPQLKALGLDVAQAAELMGRLEQKGIEGTKALSYMSRAQVQFAKNGKTLSQGLEELNSKIASSSSETEALNLASEYFGTKGATFMLDAIKRGALDFSDFANAAQNAAGAVGDTFEGTLDPVDKMTTAMNNLKLVGADISETVQGVLAPMIEKLVEKLQAFAEWFDNLSPKMKEFIVVAAMIAAAIGPILVVLGTLIGSMGSLVIGISKLGPLVKGLSSAVGVLSKALAFLAANPIVLVVAAVVALIAILVHLWKTNEDFRNAIINAWNKIVEVIKSVVEKIKTFFTETIPDAAKALVDWFKELPDKIKQVGIDLIMGLWNGIKEKLDWLKSKVTGVIDTIKGWFTGSKGFDVHSPSKWGETLGENVSAGIAKGLIDSVAAISQATNRVVSQAQSGLTNMATPQRPVRSVSNGTPALQPVNITLQIDGKILARHLYDPLKTEEMIRGAVLGT